MNTAVIAAALATVRTEREQSIALRRGEANIGAQGFRLERLQKAQMYRGEASRERRVDAVLLGKVDADIAVDDRFTSDGIRFRVSFIQPNRSVCTLVEAIIEQ